MRLDGMSCKRTVQYLYFDKKPTATSPSSSWFHPHVTCGRVEGVEGLGAADRGRKETPGLFSSLYNEYTLDFIAALLEFGLELNIVEHNTGDSIDCSPCSRVETVGRQL